MTLANVNKQMEKKIVCYSLLHFIVFEERLFVELLIMANVLLLFVSYFSMKYFILYIRKIYYFFISCIDDVTGCQCQTKL